MLLREKRVGQWKCVMGNDVHVDFTQRALSLVKSGYVFLDEFSDALQQRAVPQLFVFPHSFKRIFTVIFPVLYFLSLHTERALLRFACFPVRAAQRAPARSVTLVANLLS
jgi:hypothetical protein